MRTVLSREAGPESQDSPDSSAQREKAMAPHSSTLAWKIPWMEEPGRLQFLGSLRFGHDWAAGFVFTFHFHALEKEMAPHSNVLAWRIPGRGEPGGLLSMGSHRAGHNWTDLAAAAAGILAWKIPWTEIGARQGTVHGSQKVGQNWAHTHTYLRKHILFTFPSLH